MAPFSMVECVEISQSIFLLAPAAFQQNYGHSSVLGGAVLVSRGEASEKGPLGGCALRGFGLVEEAYRVDTDWRSVCFGDEVGHHRCCGTGVYGALVFAHIDESTCTRSDDHVSYVTVGTDAVAHKGHCTMY